MKFFRAVAPRWYGHANDATLAISALLVIAYFGFELLFTDVAAELNVSIPFSTFIISIFAVVYTLIGYRFASKKSYLFAALGSYVFLGAAIGSLIIGTGGIESSFVALWMIPAFLCYMFGWPVLTVVWLATNIYLVFESFSEGAGDDLTLPILYFITLQLPFMVSYMIWRRPEVGKTMSDDKAVFNNKDLSAQQLIESIAEGFAVVDVEGKVQVFNEAAESITGWSKEDALGLNYRSVLRVANEKGEDLQPNEDPIKIVLSSGETKIYNDLSLRTKSDKSVEVTLVVSSVGNKDDGIKAATVVFRDVSEERNQQRQRAEFISTASHEMRTPVTAIEGYLALAMNDKVSKIDSAARGYLDKAHASTQHLGKLFQDLLTAAKSEDGRLTNNPVVTDMSAFMEALVEDLRIVAEKKGLQVIQNFGAGAIKGSKSHMNPVYLAHVDPERIREVLVNLFDNAVKYTEEGKITIGFTGTNDSMTISIADTGAGIPPEDVSHLFQKFYRVDNSATRQIGGTGLGLFICKKIVELYNGRIWVESKLGEGSTFFIELPRLDQAKADQLKQLEASQSSPLPTPQSTVQPSTDTKV